LLGGVGGEQLCEVVEGLRSGCLAFSAKTLVDGVDHIEDIVGSDEVVLIGVEKAKRKANHGVGGHGSRAIAVDVVDDLQGVGRHDMSIVSHIQSFGVVVPGKEAAGRELDRDIVPVTALVRDCGSESAAKEIAAKVRAFRHASEVADDCTCGSIVDNDEFVTRMKIRIGELRKAQGGSDAAGMNRWRGSYADTPDESGIAREVGGDGYVKR